MKNILLIAVTIAITGLSHAATYYVATTGNDSNPGTAALPWRTLQKGASTAVAGDTVYIEGGNYGNELVVVSNSGTSTAPIVFTGYNGIPVLDGINRTGTGISISEKNHVTFTNIELSMYFTCVDVSSSTNITLNNIVVGVSGGTASNGRGIALTKCTYSTLRNCQVTDNGGVGIWVRESDNNLLDECRVYSTTTGTYETDYYICLSYARYNTVQNCGAYGPLNSTKGNHGIGIKDHNGGGDPSGYHSHDNTILNCEAYRFEECFFVAHSVYNNQFINCYGDNTGKSGSFNNIFMVRDNSYNNTFKNCRGAGKSQVVCLYFYEDYIDDADRGVNTVQANNSFVNCIFQGGATGVFMRNAQNTTFQNCEFVNIANLFRFSKNEVGVDENFGTNIRNCIIYGVPNPYETTSKAQPWALLGTEAGYDDMGDVTTTYTNFWSSFLAFAGTGNTSQDPSYIGPIDTTPKNSDFHLKSQYGRWNGNSWVNDAVTSPCIDAGKPADTYSNEPAPNGGRINMGAYGNSAEASKSAGTPTATTISTAGSLALTNISFRGYAGTGTSTLIVGFNLSGTGAKELLIRGVGPALEAFGLVGVVADPTLRLDGLNGALVAQNNDWGGTPTIGNAGAGVGAFALPASSKDAVLLQTLSTGGYTAQIGGGTGVALVEVYDTGAGTNPRLTNISARTQVGTGDDILIVGFMLSGTGTRQFLIRGVGPTLGAFGVTGVLTDPILQLYRLNGPLLSENDDWGSSSNATENRTTAASVGAFPLTNGSLDAVLLVDLVPGGYTAQVSGVGGRTGVALVEVYEVP